MVVWDTPTGASGGVAGHVRGLSRAMARLGHEVAVLATRESAHDPLDEDTDAVRVLTATTGLPWLPDDEIIADVASANHHLVSLVGELGTWRPDVVHVHDWMVGWSGHTIARIFDVPLVTTFHSTERSRHAGVLPVGRSSAVHSIESWLALNSSDVICCSRFMVREVMEAFEVLDDLHLVPHGIDVDHWLVGDEHPRNRTVLAWGRVQYEKGFQILAQAMAIVRASLAGVDCIIAGRGPYLPELQSQIDIEGVSDLVHLVGYVPDSRLRELLHTCGCVVIPSLYEPFGIVALESLAAGAPTIVARTGGLAEIVEGTESGLLFEPGNAHELADRILRVLTDRDLSLSLVAQGSNLVQHRYSWTAVADETLDVYRRARE